MQTLLIQTWPGKRLQMFNQRPWSAMCGSPNACMCADLRKEDCMCADLGKNLLTVAHIHAVTIWNMRVYRFSRMWPTVTWSCAGAHRTSSSQRC
eukprot:scaffold305738_cov26-Tisochrysis_lutea.AAC.1